VAAHIVEGTKVALRVSKDDDAGTPDFVGPEVARMHHLIRTANAMPCPVEKLPNLLVIYPWVREEMTR